jgi:predicted enzyme related to lactoylglutathione lyase
VGCAHSLKFPVRTIRWPRRLGCRGGPGLTHLSFRVPDVAGTAARIVELGGAVIESSRTTIDLGGSALEFLHCTDPDGVRVELMDLGG